MTRFTIRTFSISAMTLCLAATVAAKCAQAQQNSLFGASGPMSGSSGLGTGTTGPRLGASSGTQGTGMASSPFPTPGGFGQGQTGQGQTGQGLTGMAGQQRTGLVGQSNQRFVGMAGAGQNPQGLQNQPNNRQGQNRNNSNRRQVQNQNQANQANQAGGGAGNQQRSIRPRLLVAFDPPRPTVETTETTLATRFEKLAGRADFEGITVEVEGKTVILRGEVDSADTSRKAAMLSRLQPGVSSVQNELTVRPKAPMLPDEPPALPDEASVPE